MRQKNAKRQHFIAPWTEDGTEPTEESWLRLAHWIETIEDDSDEDTDDQGFYDGDGNTESVLNGRTEKWNYSGSYDAADPAHVLLASMRRITNDDGRKVWHKIIETNGDVIIGIAKVMEPKAGGGDATDYETLEGHLDYIKTPTVTPKGTQPDSQKLKVNKETK